MTLSQDKKTFILHVGYAKCGSTTMQNQVFPELEDVTYLGNRKGAPCHLLPLPPTLYELSTEEAVNSLQPYIKHISNSVIALSREGFLSKDGLVINRSNGGLSRELSHISSDGRNGDVDPKLTAWHLKRILIDGLGDLIEPRIVIMIRRQGDLLPSFYAQHAHLHLEAGYYEEGFENFVRYIRTLNGGALMEYFNYHRVAKAFTDQFGADKVKVVPMEGLFDRTNSAERRLLANFCGLDPEEVENVFSSIRALNVRSSVHGDQVEYNLHPMSKHSYFGDIMKRAWLQIRNYLAPFRSTSWFKKVRKSLRRFHRQFGWDEPIQGFHVAEARRIQLTEMFCNSNRVLGEQYDVSVHEYGYINS